MLYRWLLVLAVPFLKIHLKRRLSLGKEDPERLQERMGIATRDRSKGKLLWIHAASVGESVSVLKLIETLNERYPLVTILLTTGTITSARLMNQRLPKSVIHQYVPLDVPAWAARFLNHWRPDHVIFLESELWPNLLKEIQSRGIPCWLLNARLSPKSYQRWKFFRRTVSELLNCFDKILTPTPQTRDRLIELGARHVELSINLKYTADPLPVNLQELSELKKIIDRPILAVVSTHAGEEEFILKSIQALKNQIPNVLTLLAPRHPDRSETIMTLLSDVKISWVRRSEGQIPTNTDDVWLFDTIGDLGLVYSLAPICVLGGSFEVIGGHNPIEPFNLGCMVIQGPNTFNFTDTNQILAGALTEVSTQSELTHALLSYYLDPKKIEDKISLGQTVLESQRHGLDNIIRDLTQRLA